jgi:hypothetical protein
MKPNAFSRRMFAVFAVAGIAMSSAGLPGMAIADEVTMRVFKSPYCGCCAAWVDHMREAGFRVEVTNLEDMTPAKAHFGIADDLQSCHTAQVDGYVIEGHVPADDVNRLLAERPEAAGLSVPGMPIGSPGMEQGDRSEPYDVVLFDRKGGRSVFSHH